MYYIKKIIDHDEVIVLPKCMYAVKNIYSFDNETNEKIDINVRNQVIKFLKMPSAEMADLELRQDQLLKKLDILYDRIVTISSFCKVNEAQVVKTREKSPVIQAPGEIVMVSSPDYLPWFLKKILKESSDSVTFSWHIHSSVPNDKVPKIKAFVKQLHNTATNSKVIIRLIFKCVSANAELKLSSLELPIVGNVNILRYLSLIFPVTLPYDSNDYNSDNLLDICYLLERSHEKNKEALTKKLFSQCKNWIYKNEFTVIDAAAYNTLKQWQNGAKYAPKDWFSRCEKMF